MVSASHEEIELFKNLKHVMKQRLPVRFEFYRINEVMTIQVKCRRIIYISRVGEVICCIFQIFERKKKEHGSLVTSLKIV